MSTASKLTLGDINGDGSLDLVVIPFSEEFVLVYPNNGDGSFGEPKSYDGGDIGPSDVAVTDFDSDGANDLIVTNFIADRFSTLINQCDVPAGCNAADLAEPFGVLDLGDINAFVSGFVAQDLAVDLNDDGVLDLGDINAFVVGFTAGCP